ncbi:MAG: helix-turn-helix transcriptional regulator [Solirubrobacterales bacterium]|nr:helix-turn-helix transcriptional regulator [Solirubrobacterales bacterium]
MAVKELGEQLKQVREMRGLSLKAVADRTSTSAAYIQKLERGEVDSPSPHKLLKLSKALDISYAELMELADYLLPATDKPKAGQNRGLLAQALRSSDLSPSQERQVAEYISFLKHQSDDPPKKKPRS